MTSPYVPLNAAAHTRKPGQPDGEFRRQIQQDIRREILRYMTQALAEDPPPLFSQLVGPAISRRALEHMVDSLRADIAAYDLEQQSDPSTR